ncbi:MAG: Phosphate transporter [Thermoleophilia bacterium]|nr:Phosphate transporter [Thermoleophilia bacterium]MCZ4496608.1 Phosphate transporter [Thermoleophilia bacterium]
MVSTLVMVILLALVFDFTNGFHDTANSIATMVGTRALDPKIAVAYAAVLNFIGALSGSEVAATVGKGIIEAAPNVATLEVALAGLAGAITWNLVTWFYGLPSSSSHALVGGLVGAAVAQGNTTIYWSGVREKVLIPSLIAPMLGLIGGLVVMAILMRMVGGMSPRTGNKAFRRAQILSGGWLSFAHGLNDAQKAMGVMMLALIAAGSLDSSVSEPPMWVKLSAALAMGLGTYAGGWKIIKTLGGKMVKMSPMQGFSASIASAGILTFAEHNGMPVSTTHVVTGSVLGAGAAKRVSSVRWTVVGDILTAWIMTLPMAGLVGALAFSITAISPVLLLVISGGLVIAMRIQLAKRGGAVAH